MANFELHSYNIWCMHTHTHAHMHTCTHPCMHTCTHPCMHTCTHPHTHTHTCMHTCTHPHMHTCTQVVYGNIHRNWRHFVTGGCCYFAGATVSLQELGSVTPLTTVFNCTGRENNLLECAQNSSSMTGSGATPTPSQGGPLQPIDGCFYLPRVNCTG